MSLRIGFDARALDARAPGIRRYTRELVGAIGRLDDEIDLVAIDPIAGAALPGDVTAGPRAPSLPTNAGRHLTGLPLAIARARLDLFHAPAYTAPLWGRVPIALTIHDVSYERRPEFYPHHRDSLRRSFYRASALRATSIIAVSSFSRDEILRAYPVAPERVHVVPEGVGPPFRPRAADVRTPPPAGPPFLLHVGDLHQRRRLDALVEAVLALRWSRPEWRLLKLVLAGSDQGAGRLASRLAAIRQSPDAVELRGHVSEDELVSLYQSAAALVYPSRYEGFGLPLLEAMACGLPVVAARSSAIPETVGDAALLVDPDDDAGWIAAVEGVLSNASLATALRVSGFARAARFTWAAAARRTVEVYRSCLSRSRP